VTAIPSNNPVREITFHGTYKNLSDRKSIRKSGKGPFKLLFDKSLKGKIYMDSYNFESPIQRE